MPRHPTAGPRTAFVGANIRKQREKRKLTQVQLAEKMGLTQQIIAKLELGRSGIRIETLFDIAEALEVQPAVFLRGVMDVPR